MLRVMARPNQRYQLRQSLTMLVVVLVGAAIGIQLAAALFPAAETGTREIIASGTGAVLAMLIWGRLDRS